MYNNSDGYILIDMKDVNMTLSTQHINGIFNRIVEVIDTNKLAVVINAGDNTPMAAIVHKKFNYYVINTTLYIFTINSNDIVIVEEAGQTTVDVEIVPTLMSGTKIADYAIGAVTGELFAPTPTSEINDSVIAENSTWSSDKINTELSGKADSSSLASVATSGNYTDLSNKPTIPTKTSELTNDSGFITSAQVPPIDDSKVSSTSVWSSYKTSAELGNKANSSDVYDKTSIDNALSNKANVSDIPQNVSHRLSVNSNTISALVSFHSFIMLAGYVYLFVRTSPTYGQLFNLTDGTVLATVNGTGSFGILNFSLSSGVLTITTNDNSSRVMSIFS